MGVAQNPSPPGCSVAQGSVHDQVGDIKPFVVAALFERPVVAIAVQRPAFWHLPPKPLQLPSGAYATLADVMRPESGHGDEMESFVLSETLKYLYLLFANTSALDLSRWVLTTEAHPLPIA